MEQLAIILAAPFTEQNFRRMGIPYLSKYFDIIAIQCMPWIAGKEVEVKCIDAQYLKKVKDEHQFEIEISKLNTEFAFDYVGVTEKTRTIQDILHRYNIKLVVQKTGTLPYAKKSFLDNLKFSFNDPIYYFKLAQRYLKASLLKSSRILPPDISLLAGAKSMDGWNAKAAEKIWIHSNDYEIYRTIEELSSEQNQAKPNYSVFLDEFLPYHHDFKLLSLKNPISNPDEYFRQLDKIFSFYENHFKSKVIVAAHPASNYSDKKDVFKGRIVEYGKTAELVKDADFVFSHMSTSVSFAVLYKKPILFLTNHKLARSIIGWNINTFAKELNAPIVNMNIIDERRLVEIFEGISPDLERYQDYIINYIKTEDVKDSPQWEPFVRYQKERTSFVNIP